MLCISGVPMDDRKSMKSFKVGQISPQGMLICNILERFIYMSIIQIKYSICTIYGGAALCYYY